MDRIPKNENLSGKRFGKLLVIEKAGIDKWDRFLWLCECDCGNKIIKKREYFFRRNLLCSCGCANSRKKRIFEPNQRFGKLVLIKQVGINKWDEPLWLCKCDCGKEVIKSKAYFFRKNNPLRSCGCDVVCGNTFKDLTGKRYGRLVVIKLDRTEPNYKNFWLCKCDCGKEKIVAGACLYSGNSRSCGCLGAETILRGLLPGEAGYNKLKSTYIRSDRNRGLKFKLSDEEFKSLVTGNCYYCGAVPSKIRKVESERSAFTYNGIDRIDHLRGYEKGNVVSCCEKCNRMKNILGKDEFINQCILILKNLKPNLNL